MSPLPFAPPPKDSSLYQQLESTTLDTLTATQVDTIKEKMFSQGTEGLEDEYRRLILLGMAADKISLSGPIPGTVQVTKTVASNSGTKYVAFTPPTGTVWQIGPASFQLTGASGSVTVEKWLYGPWPTYTGGDPISLAYSCAPAYSAQLIL